MMTPVIIHIYTEKRKNIQSRRGKKKGIGKEFPCKGGPGLAPPGPLLL
jgi:hypothetical protein